MAEALSSATTILNSAWSFISDNPILLGSCCVGLLAGGIHAVKSFF